MDIDEHRLSKTDLAKYLMEDRRLSHVHEILLANGVLDNKSRLEDCFIRNEESENMTEQQQNASYFADHINAFDGFGNFILGKLKIGNKSKK